MLLSRNAQGDRRCPDHKYVGLHIRSEGGWSQLFSYEKCVQNEQADEKDLVGLGKVDGALYVLAHDFGQQYYVHIVNPITRQLRQDSRPRVIAGIIF